MRTNDSVVILVPFLLISFLVILPPVLTPSPALQSPSPSATPTAPESMEFSGPLLIDSEASRIYMSGRVGNTLQVVALAATDGRLLATYPVNGQLALDPVNRRLYVDQGDEGLAVLNLQTGSLQATISLPKASNIGIYPSPQADPTTGQVLAFRDNMVYLVDPVQGVINRFIPFSVHVHNSDALPIEGMIYDSTQRILYLKFHYSPAFRYNFSVLVSYDLTSGTEIARQEFSYSRSADIDAIVSAGSLYGTSFHWFAGPISSTSLWAWHEGKPWFTSSDWADGFSAGLHVDTKRGRLYGATDTNLLVFDAQTMALLMSAPRPGGKWMGYDPKTNQLYLLESRRLHIWPVESVQLPAPEPLVASSPPTLPVRALTISSAGAQEKTIFGIWQGGTELTDYMVFSQTGGPLYLGQENNGETTWGQSLGGLHDKSRRLSALAVSPDYTRDKTLLAGIVSMGIFKSADGGQLWLPSGVGLETMRIDELLISPGFAREQTVFARGYLRRLHRSRDGGLTWQALSIEPYRVAMSPEFDQDHTLLAASGQSPYRELYLSRDSGDSWERLRDGPNESPLTMLSLAPLFTKWQVAFAYEEKGVLYRSDNGGQNWNVVLNTKVSPSSAQLVYAPGIEANRPVFLLVTAHYNPVYNTATGYVPNQPPAEGGTLYRSSDGGQTWEAIKLPAGISPTALAISPDFAKDHLLYVGTIDGRVVALDTASLMASSVLTPLPTPPSPPPLATPALTPQDKPPVGQSPQEIRVGQSNIRYLLFIPKEYYAEPDKKWPTILFLHGMGESGNDLELLKKHGLPKIVEENNDFPFIVISPQCPPDEYAWDPKKLNMFLMRYSKNIVLIGIEFI
jgi:hypothetical protein